MKKWLTVFFLVLGFGEMSCSVLGDPIHGKWVGEHGSHIEFKEQQQFVLKREGDRPISGHYSYDYRYPHRLDLRTKDRQYKCLMTMLYGYRQRKILICFGKAKYPPLLDREKGEVFTLLDH